MIYKQIRRFVTGTPNFIRNIKSIYYFENQPCFVLVTIVPVLAPLDFTTGRLLVQINELAGAITMDDYTIV
jgi:hypothetical protein